MTPETFKYSALNVMIFLLSRSGATPQRNRKMFSSEPKAEVCDARNDDSSTPAWPTLNLKP
jgi:hypothetical protein